MNPWRGWLNAEIYDRFVRERKIYGQLNRWMVELAEIPGAERIVDLACGTGATAEACLSQMDPQAELIGVDASSAMVEVARANIRDPRVRFEVAPAASVEQVVHGPVDRVVCNAAFWQFPAIRPVVEAIARLLRPGGRFVFNIPAERVRGEVSPVHPFQAALARALERARGGVFDAAASVLAPEALNAHLSASGLDPSPFVRRVYVGKQDELIGLMSIPAMIEPLTEGLAARQRESLLLAARGSVDPDAPVQVPWVYVIARRPPSETGSTRSTNERTVPATTSGSSKKG
jgi:SAM-dependent methyltransferase